MKVLFLVAFFSFLHRSNLLAVEVYHTKTLLFKDRVFSILIPAIPQSTLCPVTALRKYMSLVRSHPDNPLFMVPANSNYQPISSKTANTFLKECMDFLGLDHQVYV